jgi:hypothetical protein
MFLRFGYRYYSWEHVTWYEKHTTRPTTSAPGDPDQVRYTLHMDNNDLIRLSGADAEQLAAFLGSANYSEYPGA